MTNANNVVLTNSVALGLGASIISGMLTVTAGGSITETGALMVTGASTFTVSAAMSDIVLDTQANDFVGPVTITSNTNVRDLGFGNVDAAAMVPLLPTGLRNLTLVFNNAPVALPGVTLTGSLSVTAGGPITQTGPLVVAATTALAAGPTNDITLNDPGNSFVGAVSIASANNVTLVNSGALVLGASTISGALSVTAGGSITETGALMVTGTSTFTVTAAMSDILLDTQANNFIGAVTITNNGNVRDLGLRNTNTMAMVPALPTGLRNLTLIFNNAPIKLPGVTLTGNLVVSAGGTISESGAL